jgi:hypothetical protein
MQRSVCSSPMGEIERISALELRPSTRERMKYSDWESVLIFW